MSNNKENLDDVIASLLDDFREEDPAHEPPTTVTGEAIILSERAAKQVQKIKSEIKDHEHLYLRVAVEGGGCSGLSYKLGLDHRTEDDKVFESFGVELIVHENHLLYLQGIHIDYPDGLDARGFTFNNPNAVDNCGCGTSFSI